MYSIRVMQCAAERVGTSDGVRLIVMSWLTVDSLNVVAATGTYAGLGWAMSAFGGVPIVVPS